MITTACALDIVAARPATWGLTAWGSPHGARHTATCPPPCRLLGPCSLTCGLLGSRLQRDLEALFAKYQVDVVFSGHVHGYLRTCSVLNYRCQQNNTDGSQGGITHIM